MNTVPLGQTVNEDTDLAFSAGNGNLLSTADIDVDETTPPNNTLQVSLTVDHGTLTLAQVTGLTITSGANGSANMMFRGTASSINAALNGMTYRGDTGYTGSDRLDIVTSDLGKTGSGGALVDADSLGITVQDATAPTVTNITSSTPNGAYKAGAALSIQVTFSEAVNVTGTPQITLETGAIDTAVNYSSGGGSTTLVFVYTVAAGHASPDLDYVSANALVFNGGTIKDAAGNNAALTLPVPGTAGSLGANKALVIDTEAPAAPPAPDLQASSDTGFSSSDNVTLRTTPTFNISGVESNSTVALLSSVDGVIGTVTVGEGQASCMITPAVALTQGAHVITATQTDLAGNVSPVSPALAPDLTIDTAAPTASVLSPADNAADVGPSANLVMTFSENVMAASGNVLIRKSSDNTVFEQITVTDPKVTVAGNQVTVDPTGAFTSQTGYYIQIDAGGFWDAAGNYYAGIADTSSWDFTTADIVAPTVVGVSSNKADGYYRAGEAIDIRVTFSETVEVTGTPQITLETGAIDTAVNYSSGGGSTTIGVRLYRCGRPCQPRSRLCKCQRARLQRRDDQRRGWQQCGFDPAGAGDGRLARCEQSPRHRYGSPGGAERP